MTDNEVIRSNASGSVQLKSGHWYTVIAVTIDSSRKSHWKATGLKKRGNKRSAEAILAQRIAEYNTLYPLQPKPEEIKKEQGENDPNPLFSDFLERWIRTSARSVTEKTTDAKWSKMKRIHSFFDDRKIHLLDLTVGVIEDFYETLYDAELSGTTVRAYHQFMNQAIRDAVRRGKCPCNIFDRVVAPKKSLFVGDYYSAEEVNQMLDLAESDPLYIPILLASYYGLRRAEVLGMKWSAIDFVNHTISVQGSVSEKKSRLIITRGLKTDATRRTLPLLPEVAEILLAHKAQIALNKKRWKSAYTTLYEDMVCVNPQGVLFRPGYVTEHFPGFLEKNGMRRIRFHDLRHTCASLLVNRQVDMAYIQRWLGHANYSTTADIYAHLDCSTKTVTAEAISLAIGRGAQPAA